MRRGSLSAAIVAAIASAVLAACTSPTPVASDAPLASTAAQPQTPATPQAQIGAFGLDLAGGDASVKPGDNFYRYAGGTWRQNNPIPPDQTLWDTFQILASKSEIAVRDLIEDLAKQPDLSPVDRKIADYYRAFMDEAAIEAAGLKPIAQDLERMTKARTKAELLSAAADPPALGRLPINAYVGLDPRNPDRYIAFVLHGGLGLPDREYVKRYFSAEAKAKMLDLVGKCAACLRRAHRQSDLDEPPNQGGSTRKTGCVRSEDRLPGSLARLQCITSALR
jgi:putative endopeptidase